MPNTVTYTVSEVDLEAGYIAVHIVYPDETNEDVNFKMSQVISSDDAPETAIKAALDQLVQARYTQQFPPPPPRPESATALVGQTYTVEGD
uniref:Uncharacterized protein n=1 Tax=Pseudomonas phage Cygsa01 TaxID=3138529 RepID=A0AAU6W3F0_9VIRU